MTAKERVALVSIVATILITAAKAGAGWVTGSLALISDAAQSLLDVAATIVTFLVVRAADRPPDEEHPYGHGKFESVAAFGQTALLCALSGIVAFEGVRRLSTGSAHVETSSVAFVILALSILVDAWRWRSLVRTARETGSEALAADALHFSSDLVNSCLVLAALAAAAAGFPQADPLVAIGVAFFIAIAGWRLGRRTIDSLVDAAPRDATGRIVENVGQVPGVVGLDWVKLRRAGGETLGEVGIRVARSLPLERVADIKEAVSASIAEAAPEAKIVVTANPTALDDETIRERILLVAARRRLPVHHVMIQHVGDKLSISLDVEVDGDLSLGEAHRQASELEEAIKAEFGGGIEVDTHIEPLETQEQPGADAEPALCERIGATLSTLAHETSAIGDIHSVRVRRTPAGLIVNYHCRVDPGLAVSTMHRQVDQIEHGMRARTPEIHRVIGHAEPRR